MKYLSPFLFIFLSLKIFAQDTIPEESTNQRIIEDIVEQGGGDEESFDFNTQFEQLTTYLNKPLNLNKATSQDLQSLGLLSPVQINQLIVYRRKVGDLIAIEELQAVPSFDLNTIEKILPYVRVKGKQEDFQTPLKEMLRKGGHTILTRVRAQMVSTNGIPNDFNQNNPSYQGNPYQWYVRYQYQYDTKLKYGLTMEKDAGEEFLTGSNPQGFDFYSGHFYVRDPMKGVKDVAIGDFEAKFGQGLLVWSGFGFGKSSFAMNVKRLARPIKAYTSVNEFAYFRGLATTIQITPKLELTIFFSYKNRDGNVAQFDTLDNEILEVSSLQTSGLHRTLAEISDKNSIQELMIGNSIKYKLGYQGHIAFNTSYTRLSAPLIRSDNAYNALRFQGQELLNASLDYSYVIKNFNFFGETAMSDNGGWASLNGLLISLTEAIDISILQRNFQPNYHTLYTNTFAETRGTNNEIGTYIGIQIKPSRKWQYSFYADNWRHPWLRFQTDAPSRGFEYLGQITYQPKKSTQVYFRWRDETKETNSTNELSKVNSLVSQRKIQSRLHFQHQIHKKLSIKSRIELSNVQTGDDWERGYLMYQDLIYSASELPIKLSTRFAVFNTSSYESRIYAYENDLLNSFSVPPVFGQGSRFYVNLSYSPLRNLLLQIRYAQTQLYDTITMKLYNQNFEGNTKSDIKLQLRWKF